MTTTCTASEQGIECRYTAVMIEPVPLCEEHRIQVAMESLPDILAAALRDAGSRGTRQHVPAEESHALTVGAVPVETLDYLAGVHTPIVYFISNGSRVKIGTSTNLRHRLRSLALSSAAVALLLRGGATLERALHRRFEVFRIAGTEWFEFAEPVSDYVAAKLDHLGHLTKEAAESIEIERLLAQEAEQGAVSILAVRVARAAAARAAVVSEAALLAEAERPEELAPVPEPRPSGPTYPNGDEIDEKHVQLWHALTDTGVDGATAVELAATAESDGHQYTSEAWIRQRLRFWKSQGYIRAVKEGREERHWVAEQHRVIDGEVSA